jgi:hypothetical protein
MSPSMQKADTPGGVPPDDASIPVLTERLTLPPLELDTTLPPDASLQIDTSLPQEPPRQAPAPRAAPPAAAPASPPRAAAPAPSSPAGAGDVITSGSHWTRIEVELRSSILQSVAEALPREVDAIVRSRMSEAIDQLVTQLAAETRLALAASLRDIVDHAVRVELNRLRTLRR